MRNPYKPKHQTMAAYKNAKPVQLRCLTDGSLRLFFDDGPHDAPQKTAHSGRAALLKKIRQRNASPIDGEPVPVFVFDPKATPGPVPRIYDTRINEFVEPVVMNAGLEKVMAAFCESRNAVAMQVEQAAKKKAAEAEQAAEQGAMKLLAALGDKVSKTKAVRHAE